MSGTSPCVSCSGSGEVATDYGPTDCPDCGGAGRLPSRSVLTEWRAGDIERNVGERGALEASDARWLLSELRTMRTALNEVIALAHDIRDDEQIALRIRMVASRAIGLYETVPLARDQELREPRQAP